MRNTMLGTVTGLLLAFPASAQEYDAQAHSCAMSSAGQVAGICVMAAAASAAATMTGRASAQLRRQRAATSNRQRRIWAATIPRLSGCTSCALRQDIDPRSADTGTPATARKLAGAVRPGTVSRTQVRSDPPPVGCTPTTAARKFSNQLHSYQRPRY